ncbi:hypothetical protein Golax_004121 [Gossypium laxum]|uniref:Uncharacterized protein n=1 Tax=Gossypium laxum TaxID=34288 RepID=A0A7J9AJC4_9ROSI|nr:hypothetical protein [Gossypium laxum]
MWLTLLNHRKNFPTLSK